ncbi:MAG: DNA polymerase III subunit delta [Lachnospiraceae bacterium]|nr:DNA polymerase III subunit delta [Lachnospiraceae bacterium]
MKNDDMLEKLKKISASIKSKEFFPFYYLYGDEDYFLTQVKNSILKAFSDDTKLNTKVYTKDNFVLNDVMKYLGNLPFMNEKKLIIFDGVDYFVKNRDASETKDMIDAFEKSKDINIVVFFKYENGDRYLKSYDKSNVFLKYFSDNGIAVNTHKLDEASLNKYIINHFKKSGIEIDKVEGAYFIRTCGCDLNNLYNEADKLISYVGDRNKIERKDIDSVVTKNIDDKIYNLIDLYNSNKKEEALKFYGDLLSEGEKVPVIFSVFAYNYSSLIVCKDLMQRGKGQKDIAEAMGIEPWRVAKLMSANKYVSMETLEYQMKRITDIALSRVKGNLDEDYMLLLLMN